jgi:hypothetical protein
MEGDMVRGLLDRAPAHEDRVAPVPPPLRLLDRALDRELARACALVGGASGAGAQVILEAAVGAHPVAVFWAACDVRAAELCDTYGVELLLVEEDGRVRIRIDQYHATDPSPRPWWGRRTWWPWSGRGK